MKFYTNFYVNKSTLLIREYDNGIENIIKKKISPSYYFVTDKESEHKSIYGHNLIKLDYDTQYEARDWLKQYETMKDKIFGFPHYEYTMINEMYPDMKYDTNKLLVGVFDIETEAEGRDFNTKHQIKVRNKKTPEIETYLSIFEFEQCDVYEYEVYDEMLVETKEAATISWFDSYDKEVVVNDTPFTKWIEYHDSCYFPKGGFSDAGKADESINLISMVKKGRNHNGEIMCFGYGDAVVIDKDATYIRCENEAHLLKEFITYWQDGYVDVITGWNIANYDIIYIIKRIEIVLGEDWVKKLSPYKIITGKVEKNIFGSEYTKYTLAGLTVLDYLEIYKKFNPKVQESYKLDFIASMELNDNKIEYEGSFRDFYTKDFQRFVEYNIHDTRLVFKLDKKLGYINLAATIAYKAKVSLDDITGTVRVWDVIIANELAINDIHVPTYNTKNDDTGYGGGYVKVPLVGFYEWLLSIDATSLYPSEIMYGNVSPETLVDPKYFIKLTPDDLLEKTEKYYQAIAVARSLNATLCANGAMFYKDREGIIPNLTNTYFQSRVYEKNLGKQYDGVATNIKKILKERGVSYV